MRQIIVVYFILSSVLTVAFCASEAYGAAIFCGFCAVFFPALWLIMEKYGPLW
jgi:thiol-disulfide isomerase/thioredoxin